MINNIILQFFLIYFLAYNPTTGEYQNCVVFKIEKNPVTLWDIQEFAVWELAGKDIDPTPKNVSEYIKKNRQKIINDFIIFNETQKIGFGQSSENDFENVLSQKEDKIKNNKYFNKAIKLYSLSVTDISRYFFMKSQINNYLFNFIYRFIEVSDNDIKEYTEKHPLVKISVNEIKNILLLKKRKKKYNMYIKKLKDSVTLEKIHYNFSCN